MTPEGQDLAAVIAEMRSTWYFDPHVGHVVSHDRVSDWADRLALLLVEAQHSNQVQVQENQEVARVDAMGDSTDTPTASENETTPATVTPTQVSNEVRADVSEIRDYEANGPLESTDLWVRGRGVSLLVNLPAGSRGTYSLIVDGKQAASGNIHFVGALRGDREAGCDDEGLCGE